MSPLLAQHVLPQSACEEFEEEEANESQSILGGATEGLNDEGSASDDGDDAPALEDGVVEGDPLLISDSEVAAEEDELFGDQDEEVSAADRTEKVLNEADLAIATLKAEEEAYQVFLSEQDEHAYKEFLAEQDSGMAGDLMKVNKETAEKAASELPVGEVPESGHEVVGAVAAAMEVAEPSASASSLHDLDHGEGEEDEKQVALLKAQVAQLRRQQTAQTLGFGIRKTLQRFAKLSCLSLSLNCSQMFYPF